MAAGPTGLPDPVSCPEPSNYPDLTKHAPALPDFNCGEGTPIEGGGGSSTNTTSSHSNDTIYLGGGTVVLGDGTETITLNGTIDLTGATVLGLAAPQWIKITKTYADFATAATTNTITAYTLPARTVLHAAILKHTVAFTGGALATYNIAPLYNGNGLFSIGLDVLAAPSDTGFDRSDLDGGGKDLHFDSFAAGLLVELAATCTGADLDAAVQGSADLYLLLSTLP